MKNNYRIADTFWTRIRGRLGETIPSQPLYIPRCNVVHTFGMKFPLRLTWFDGQGKVIREQLAVPNKFYGCKGAASVLESHPEESSSLLTDNSGQALVEAAFALPVLLVIVFGFIQIGLAVHQAQKLTYVTHYATQVGALTNDPDKISGAIEEFLDATDFTLSIESRDKDSNPIADIDRQHNDILTVKVTHPFSLQIPLVSISVINLTAEASARILCPNNTTPFTCNS
jgi:hypothetical protein